MQNTRLIFLRHADTQKDPSVNAAMWGLSEKGKQQAEEAVIAELCETIYSLKSPARKNKLILEQNSSKNENGLIVDETDKWYKDAAIYHIFSNAEDPQNICFDIVREQIKNIRIVDPIDLATGTGRMFWQIINKINFEGILRAVDMSADMCDFLRKDLKRERGYTKNTEIIQSSIENLSKKISKKSSFIISSFGFPSKITNKDLCIRELKAIYSLLSDNGVFVTLGWDETFNDELSEMWFSYIPDDIRARNFEEWRRKRAERITSARNCGLTWLKKGIHVPLQFDSLRESATVMGYLFGRDASLNIIKNNKTEWMMSLGITFNDKKSLKKIIEEHERN